jgi:two-component system LytT family response regulator
MLGCYVIDDEQNSVDALCAMLKKKFSKQVQLLGSSTSAVIAIEDIDNLQPDVVFLDVEMPEMNGLQLLKHFPARNFHVIFTTAHEKYALPALKAAATDYLMKPLSPQDVYDAIQKCVEKKSIAAPAGSSVSNKIGLSTSQEFILVNVDDIIRVEASNNYSHFYFTNRQKVIVSKTLKEFDEQLERYNFFRVHQSHLVNMNYVESVQSNDGDYVLLAHGHKVEISRRKKPEFLLRLKG